MTAHTQAARICLLSGCVFLAITIALGFTYYLYFRPRWAAPDVLAPVERLLKDPAASAESIRHAALKGHDTLLASFAAVDAAVLFMLLLSLVAGIAFFYVFAVLSRTNKSANENAL